MSCENFIKKTLRRGRAERSRVHIIRCVTTPNESEKPHNNPDPELTPVGRRNEATSEGDEEFLPFLIRSHVVLGELALLG